MAPKALKSALKPQSRSDRAAKIELWALVSSSFVWACGQWIVAPALPYFAMAKGCHAFHYAMISSAYAASQMISSPILGMLSERIGRRPILLGGLATTSVVYLLMANVTTVFQLLLARATLGFLSGAAAVEVAFVADLTSKTDRVDWVNMQTRLQSAGCLLGPAIGGMVAPYSRADNDATMRFEFEHLCYAISILVMLNFLIGIGFFTCPPSIHKAVAMPQSPQSDRPKRFVSSYFLKQSTMILLLVCFLDAFSLAVSDGPEAFFLHDKFGFAAAQQATFMMTCSASSLIWGSLAPYVIGLCPANVVCMLFSLFSAAAMVLMSMTRYCWTPYFYAILFGSSVTIVEVASKTTLVGQLVPEKKQGAVYGMERGLLNLGFSLGPLVGGSIYQFSLGLPYMVSACCLCVSSLVYLMLPSRSRGQPLLPEDDDEGGSREALEHWSNQAPLPAKRIGAVIVAERARRVYFVCPELYEAYRNNNRNLVRRHSGGELPGSSSAFAALRSNTIGEPLSQVLDRHERQVSLGDEVVRYSDPDLNKLSDSQDGPRIRE